MHVALVSEHASPLALLGGDDAGGQNVHVAELARALGRLGVRVVVHTRRDDPALPRTVPFGPNVTVEHVDAGPAEPIPKDELLGHMEAFAVGLADSWRRQRPDVVHSHFWMSGLASLGAARPLGLPVIHTFHALGREKRREQAGADTSPEQRVAVEEAIACLADALIATTYTERRALIAMGAAPEAVQVIPCGVDLAQFTPRGPVAPPRRSRARVVVVSRMVRRKGIGTVIEAMRAVPDAELLVAGGPPAGLVSVEAEGSRLAALTESTGVADRVELLGALPRPDVPPLLRSADVVVCCPWYEPFGIVAVEAMACGRPVIASAVGGLAETVVPGENGWLVPPRDVDALGRALAEALGDTSRRITLGRQAAASAVRYNWDAIGAETLSVMRAVADRYRPALLKDRR